MTYTGSSALVPQPPTGSRSFQIDPRLLWPKEVAHLVPWLEANIDLLGQCLGLRLTVVARETRVGEDQMRADLLVRDEDGRMVIVEAQLGRSDNRRLGQLFAYAANGHEAFELFPCNLTSEVPVLLVWVVADMEEASPFKPEHVHTLCYFDDLLKDRGIRLAGVEVTVESDWYPAGTEREDAELIPRMRLIDLDKPWIPAYRRAAYPPLTVRDTPPEADHLWHAKTTA